MSTISLKSGVRTRNWLRINFQPLEFNFEFYFWRFRGGGGGVFLSFSKESNSRPLYQAQNLFRIAKKSSKIIIFPDVRFTSVKKPTKMHYVLNNTKLQC